MRTSKDVSVHKASPIVHTQPTPDVTISIADQISDNLELADLQKVFVNDARALERALFDSLPGGTYDQLLLLMFKRQATLRIIPHAEATNA
jgi:hypothetical protein